jgi:CubicO group peptidase (beta-lactamase class C family)
MLQARAMSAVDRAVVEVMRRSGIPGMTVAVTRHDEVLHQAGFGRADLAAGTPAEPSTGFLWFSLSKIATATAVVALSDAGRLDLDGPVDAHVSGVPGRIRQLLNHTAGLPNPPPIRWVRPATAPPPDPARFLADLLRRYGRLRRPPGGPARYSNLGYLVLAEIVAAVTGEPFTEHVTRTLLVPAGMKHTSYAWTPGTATGYVRAPRLVGSAMGAVLPGGVLGAQHGAYRSLRPFVVNGPGYGGLVGPVTDAARLAALHLGDGVLDGHRFLAPESARLMRTIATPGKVRDLGLGWFRSTEQRYSTPAFAEHLGAGAGYFTVLRIYPDVDLGVALMANTTRAYDHDALCAAACSEWA